MKARLERFLEALSHERVYDCAKNYTEFDENEKNHVTNADSTGLTICFLSLLK